MNPEKNEKHTLKHAILIALGLALVFFLAISSVDRYVNYQKKHQNAIVNTAAQQNAERDVLQQDLNDARQRARDMKSQCDVGLQAYQALPAVTKAKMPMPDCELSFN